MKITIDKKLCPFSTIAGSSCVIPGTLLILEAFPTFFKVGDLTIATAQGPVENFTLQLDLQRDCVWIFSRQFRLRVRAHPKGIEVKRGRDVLVYEIQTAYRAPQTFEKLSLGSHKAGKVQDTPLHLETFIPLLFALGQKIPLSPSHTALGTASLLPFHDLVGITAFCKAALHSLLVPRLTDSQHQGFCSTAAEGNPFFLLTKAYQHLRSLFVIQTNSTLQILPQCLFPAGRMIDVQLSNIGAFDFEWTKSTLRRLILKPLHSLDVFLQLPEAIRSFRLRCHPKEKGVTRASQQKLSLQAHQTYFLDCFHK